MIKIKNNPIKTILFKTLENGDIFSVGEFIEALPFQELFMKIEQKEDNSYSSLNLITMEFCNFNLGSPVYFLTNVETDFYNKCPLYKNIKENNF
jgi:hypothetical protein